MSTAYYDGIAITRDSYDRFKDGQVVEAAKAETATRALYAPAGRHEMPEQHLPAGITNPVTWMRAEWLDSIETRFFPGASLPLQYAPKDVQEARARMDMLHGKLTAIDEVAEALCEEYREQGADVKAAMTQAALEGKDPGDSAVKVEKKRADMARKYHDAVMKRDAYLAALGQLYQLVEAETRKGLAEWHDSMLKAHQERAEVAAPVLAELSKELAPLMREVLTMLGHVESARDGLGVEGAAPEPLADVAALSRALGALEAAPALWDGMTADPVLSMTAEGFTRALKAPFDWSAYERRETAIEEFRKHYRVFGQSTLTREQAGAVVDGRAELLPLHPRA